MKKVIRSAKTKIERFLSKLKNRKKNGEKVYDAKNVIGDITKKVENEKEATVNKIVTPSNVDLTNQAPPPNPTIIKTYWSKIIKVPRLLDTITILGFILWLLYLWKRPEDFLKQIFHASFTLEHFWHFIAIIIFLNYALLWMSSKLLKHQIEKQKYWINPRAIPSLLGIVSTILIAIVTAIALHNMFLTEKNKYFPKKYSEHKTINLLITKYKPIISPSYFDKSFKDIDFSSTIYQKLLTIKGYEDKSFAIDYYKQILSIKDTNDFNLIFEQKKYDAILTGEIFEENNSYKTINYLYVASEKYREILKKWNNTLQITNHFKKDSTFYYFANPLYFYKNILDNYIENDELKRFSDSNFNFEYNVLSNFPSGLTFTSTIEISPYITLNYLRMLNFGLKIDSLKQNSLSLKKVYIDSVMISLDGLINRINYQNIHSKSDTIPDYNFLIYLHHLKAFFINEELKYYGSFNCKLYLEKIDNIFFAAKYYYLSQGYSNDDLIVFEILFYFSIYKCIVQEHEIWSNNLAKDQFYYNVSSRIIPSLNKKLNELPAKYYLKSKLESQLKIMEKQNENCK